MTEPLNILLLEDSPLDAELVCHRLQSAGIGCHVRHVTTGADFRRALNDCGRFDLILSDYDLPDIDGMTALRETVARCPETPFIFVSGKLGEDAAVQSLQEGATDYVVKVRLERLLPAVRRAIHESSERRARRRAEAALQDAQNRLSAALEASEIGTWVWDLSTDRITADVNLVRLLGLRETGEVTLSQLLQRVDREDRDRVETALRAAARSDAPRYNFDCRIEGPNGSHRWITTRGRIEHNRNNGAPIRLLSVVIDITERKQLEIEREQTLERERNARAEAEHVSRMKDEFLATLSHELRTPLSAILGWSQILGRAVDAKNPTLANGLEVIERNARSQSRLIEDLLDMSRIVSGNVRLNLELVDMRQVLEAALDVSRPTADARAVRVEVDCSGGAATVMGDAARLQQVVWNLVSNSVKFTPADGRVTATLSCENGHVVLTISDTGRGIEPSFLPHVFERFRQADSSSTRSFSGLGLGLSIVKYLVEIHGGTVRADSEGLGKGARFTVVLPLASETREPQRPQEPPSPATAPAAASRPAVVAPVAAVDGQQRLYGLNVLVIDDEEDARLLVKHVLASEGAVVRIAGSADEARQALIEGTPHVVISDLGMPNEDGFQLMRSLRSSGDAGQGTRILAIALSAFARPVDRAQSLAAGFDEHLAKPIDVDVLVNCLAARAAALRGGPFPMTFADGDGHAE